MTLNTGCIGKVKKVEQTEDTVGLIVKCELAKSVMDVRRISLRILSVDLVLCGKVVTIISVYGLQSGQSEKDKNCFYDDLSTEVQSKNGNCIALDVNGHVENSINGYKGVHGGKGWGIRNKDREVFLEFADSFVWWLATRFSKTKTQKS